VRLYSRNAYDWTARFSAVATAAERIKAKSFTIDGEAVVLGPDGLSRFEELSRREAARTAILYAFDLIEHDGEDLRDHPFLERKTALAWLLRDTEAGILLNEHIAEDGATVFAMRASSAPRASFRSGSTAPIAPARAASGSRRAIPPASRCSGSGARSGIDEPQAARADDDPPQRRNHPRSRPVILSPVAFRGSPRRECPTGFWISSGFDHPLLPPLAAR
jgi:ATP dependent DNA ligase domain